MAIRPLNFDLQATAKIVINEDSERIEADLRYIKEWLQKQPHLKFQTDDQWLISFLRGCKHSLERTKEKLDMYYTTKTMIPEFHCHQNPFDPKINRMLKIGYALPLPLAGPDAPRVFYIRQGILDPQDSSIETITSFLTLFMKYFMLMDDNCVIIGVHCVLNFEGVTLTHVARWYPSILKKAIVTTQDAFPSRPQALHYIHLPSIFEPIFKIIRSFLSDKLNRRIHIHSDIEEFKKCFPKSILPKDIGGEGPSFEELTDEWMKKIKHFSSSYGDDTKFGCDEKKRPGKPKTYDDLFGLEGSFRPLTID